MKSIKHNRAHIRFQWCVHPSTSH